MSVVIFALFSIGFIFGAVEGQKVQSDASGDENCFEMTFKVKALRSMEAGEYIEKEYIGCGNCGLVVTAAKANSSGDISPLLVIAGDVQCFYSVCFSGQTANSLNSF